MKRFTYILFAFLLAAVSCVKEQLSTPTTQTETDGKVNISFYVDAAEANPATKAFSDDPSIQTLKVAVFGGSGYLKEYVSATFDEAVDNYDGTEKTKYKYSVRLSLSNSALKVHFIANGPSSLPFKYEGEVMGTLLVENPQDAYWQKVELPNGIRAQVDKDGDYIDINGDKCEETGLDYVVDPESVANMKEVCLVRNFARINITADAVETSHVEVLGYALKNYPQQGTVAPYDSKFLVNYQDSTFAQLSKSYEGNFPATASLNTGISDFVTAPDYVYMYERPIPSSDATFLILKANFYPNTSDLSNKVECYYKIDLQDEAGNYLPIYRNFGYTINITEITRAGYDTPEKAATSTGSGDISANISTQNLTDISDGKSRLYVSYTDTTIVAQGTYNVKVKYIPDINTGTVDNSKVTFEVGTAGEAGAVFTSVSKGSESDGWLSIDYTTTSPEDANKVQYIKVTGTATSGSTIYRYVNVRLLSKREMTVECDPHYVEPVKGKALDVNITIPKQLPTSVFPLYFKIEAENLNLTPNGDNLPVYSSKSFLYADANYDGIVYDKEKGNGASLKKNGTTIFYYIKTLQYTDYKTLSDAATGATVTFTAHFKTTDTSKGGIVYVVNDYFYDAYDDFERDYVKEFKDLGFDKVGGQFVLDGIGRATTFYFTNSDINSPVVVTLNGLEPADTLTLHKIDGTENQYSFQPSDANVQSALSLLTTTEDVKVSVGLEAMYYNDTTWAAERGLLEYEYCRFNNSTKSTTSNTVTYGKDQSAMFYFSFKDGYVEPVTVKFVGLKPTTPKQTYGTFVENSDGTYTFTPAYESTDCIFLLTTTTDGDNVSVTLSGSTYETSKTTTTRAKHVFSDLKWSSPVYLGSGKNVTFSFSYETNAVVPITITFRGAQSSDDRLTNEKITTVNGVQYFTYTYTPSNTTTIAQTIKLTTVDFGSYLSAELSQASYETASKTMGRTLLIAAGSVYMSSSGDDNFIKEGWSGYWYYYLYRNVRFTYSNSTTLFTATKNNTSASDGYAYVTSDITKEYGETEDVSEKTTVTAYYYTTWYTYTASTTIGALANASTSSILELSFTRSY